MTFMTFNAHDWTWAIGENDITMEVKEKAPTCIIEGENEDEQDEETRVPESRYSTRSRAGRRKVNGA